MTDSVTSSLPPQKPPDCSAEDWCEFQEIIDKAVDEEYRNISTEGGVLLDTVNVVDLNEQTCLIDTTEIPIRVTTSPSPKNYTVLCEIKKGDCQVIIPENSIFAEIVPSVSKYNEQASDMTVVPDGGGAKEDIPKDNHVVYTEQAGSSKSVVGIEKPSEDICEDENNQSTHKKLTKKWQSNPKNWQQNVRKNKRQHGEEYTNVKGSKVPKKMVGEKMCRSNADCPFKCSKKITVEEREQIHTSFWKLSDEKKLYYYSKNIKRYIARRKRTKKEVSKKSYTYEYFLTISGVNLRVCQEYSLNTLNISKQRIYYYFNNSVNPSTDISRTPLQGKHPKKVIAEDRKDLVRAHIKSFPTVPSHYCRANSNKQYLERNLNLRRMYELYFEATEEPVKYNVYENIFKTEFNISFLTPKKDMCDKCAEYAMNKNPTEEETQQQAQHIDRKNIGYHERNSDRIRYANDRTVGVVTFDLQNTFSIPKSDISKKFYKMKLCCYNFTAHLNVTNTVYNAIWHEFLCGRAGIHIASALVRILKEIVKDNPELQKLILWSDSCVPQNKNSIMSFALQTFLQSDEAKNVQIIEQKFGEPGHGNVQEIDNAHSCIERYLRNLDIWSPLTLIRLLLKIPSKWKLKFKIIQMCAKDYLDFQSFSARYSYNMVPYTKVKQVTYEKNAPINVQYRESFEGKNTIVKLRYTRRINLKKEVELPETVPQIVLKSVVPEQKRKHLLEMLSVMPEDERLFYSMLLKVGKK